MNQSLRPVEHGVPRYQRHEDQQIFRPLMNADRLEPSA